MGVDMTSDGERLRRHTESNSENAFAEFVRRHLDLVYSAVLRQVNGDAHPAQDVAWQRRRRGIFGETIRTESKAPSERHRREYAAPTELDILWCVVGTKMSRLRRTVLRQALIRQKHGVARTRK